MLSRTNQPWRTVRVDELIDQARLPHAGLANHGHHLAMPRSSPLQGLLQRHQLLLPPHEAGEPACRTGLQAAADGTGPDQLKDLHRLGESFDGKLPQGVDLDEALSQPERRRGQPDTARGGELLHARRQMRGLAHGGVVHVQVVANGPHHDVAGIEPHPGLHLQTVGPAHLLGIAAHGALHGERRVTGPHGVVFMRQWGPEQRHDPVPEYLVHGAFVAVDRVHHGMQGGIEQLLSRLRIEISYQLRGALEIGKEHGDLLAFAFQGAARREDFLGQIGWGIGEGCRCGRWCHGWSKGGGNIPIQTSTAPSSSAASRWPLMSSSVSASRCSASS